mmetsp:Transcript_26183/g.57206  ORF Transcript_26183/g.57206 Transcript_26183/m.57206 type:complete len:134 (+) Transcript_26183:57-458(+)
MRPVEPNSDAVPSNQQLELQRHLELGASGRTLRKVAFHKYDEDTKASSMVFVTYTSATTFKQLREHFEGLSDVPNDPYYIYVEDPPGWRAEESFEHGFLPLKPDVLVIRLRPKHKPKTSQQITVRGPWGPVTL